VKLNHQSSCESHLRLEQRGNASTKSLLQLSVVTQFFPPDFAATGQLIDELIRQLRQQDVDVEVFTGQPSYAFQQEAAPTFEQLDGVRIKRSRVAQLWPQRIRGKAVNGILFMLRAAFYLVRHHHRRDLLLITTAPPFLPILGYLANLWFGIPYVCIFYDLYPDIAIELDVIPRRHWLAKAWRAFNYRVWRRAQGIVVLSPDMKQRIAEQCPAVAAKISVIHSWADPSWIAPLDKRENWFALRYQLIKPFTVLYSGNLGRCHDIETILEAAVRLQDEPIQFVCIGSGAKYKYLAEQIQTLQLSNLLLLPYQEREVLPYSLTACDLSLVSMSPGMESLIAPSKLYPALSAGRPIAVICPPRSYLNPLIAEARCGATFDNGDSLALAQFIKLLAADPALTEEMGRAGRQYLSANFTPRIIAQQYLTVLQGPLGILGNRRQAISTSQLG